jgi:hypothetical protein
MSDVQMDFDDYTISYSDTPEMHKAVFDAVMKYFNDHQSYHAEVIMQSDNCIIDAPEVMAIIADNVIKFKVDYKETE